MPASAPANPTPASVTVFPAPTFFVSKVPVPVRVTTSVPSTVVSVRVSVAAVVASYTLFTAVKLPVIAKAVMFAVVVLFAVRV